MRISIINYIGSAFIFTFFIFGCADLKVAKDAYNKGDYKLAYEQFDKLAKRGFPSAQKGMGDVILKQYPEDKNKALMYYMNAYKNGYKNAAKSISSIKKSFAKTPKEYQDLYNWLKKAESTGSLSSSYDIALLNITGKGVPQNINLGLSKLHNLAKKGYAKAAYTLGDFFYKGWYVKKDEKSAIGYFHAASVMGYKGSRYKEASIYADKNSQYYNPKLAKRLYLSVEKKDNPSFALKYAQFLEQENGIDKESYSWYKRASDFENISARLRIADMLRDGEFLTKDIQKAIQIYRSLGNNAVAKTRLGDIYMQYGDKANAKLYYQQAYRLGNKTALKNIANIALQEGSLNEAAQIFYHLAKEGDKNSAYKLAKILHQQNRLNQAIYWYEVSAKSDNVEAQYILSQLLGKRLPKKSIALLKQASDAGYAKAQLKYGQYLFYNKNQYQGLKLVYIAAQKGEKGAVDISLDMISKVKNLNDVNRAYMDAKKSM